MCAVCVFFLAEKGGVHAGFLERAVFFFQQKRGSLVLVLCVCSCAEEKLQQRVCRKIAAAGFLYSIKKNLIYTAGSGEIFINLF